MKSFQKDTDKYKILRVAPDQNRPEGGEALFKGNSYQCALGAGGVCPAPLKREGDGKTPAGLYFPRGLYYRRDRIPNISCPLPRTAITLRDGWCDDPKSPDYNRPVSLPHPGTHENLWREDALYDLILVISHNDSPPLPGLGSAVFFHIASGDMAATKGCVAFQKADFLEILKTLTAETLIRIHAS